jgi:hypothetical protein
VVPRVHCPVLIPTPVHPPGTFCTYLLSGPSLVVLRIFLTHASSQRLRPAAPLECLHSFINNQLPVFNVEADSRMYYQTQVQTTHSLFLLTLDRVSSKAL